jgi:hypothetical protein
MYFQGRYIKRSQQLTDSRRRRQLFATPVQRLKSKKLAGPDESYGAVKPDFV